MAELILVRHGQATAFEDDYDKLSDTGHRQAQRLGEFWASRGVQFDRAIRGGLRRHRETEEGVRAAYVAAGVPFPDLEVDEGWDEYDAHRIVGELAPRLAEADPGFAELLRRSEAARGTADQNRHFQRAFERLMAAWVEGDVVADEVEPFPHFHARVMKAFERIVGQSGAGRVAVFTSGGPIGVSVQLSLEAPPIQAMKVNARVRNASLTHFMFSKGRVSFDAYNLVHHLEPWPELLTYR